MICGVRTEGYPYDGAIGVSLQNFYELLQLNLQTVKSLLEKGPVFYDAHFFANIKDNLATTWRAFGFFCRQSDEGGKQYGPLLLFY